MNRLDELYALLADVEAQMNDTTLSHSDQQLLDQAWDTYTNEIDAIEDAVEAGEQSEWRDAAEYLESEEEEDDDWTPTGPGSVTVRSGYVIRNGGVKVVTYAPPPPPVDRLLLPSEEEMINRMVDTREGCARCSGCAYCEESAPYDGADEV